MGMRGHHYVLIGAICLTAVILFSQLNIKNPLTGYVISTFSEEAQLNTKYADSIDELKKEYFWSPQYYCAEEKCALKYVKISGEINAKKSGAVSVYLKEKETKKLIMKTEIILEKKTFREEITANENYEFYNEAANSTENKTAQITKEQEYEIEEPATIKFSEICEETCYLNSEEREFQIIAEMDAENDIKIEKIIYEWQSKNSLEENKKINGEKENLAENYPAYEEKNIANKNYLETIQNHIALADSKDLLANSFELEAGVVIPADSYGSIISKNDYINGKYIELGVNVEGTIFFDITDSQTSLTIETKQKYNDAKLHKIKIILNEETAQMIIDEKESLEAERNVGDIRNNAPVSIGENVGYIPWTGGKLSVFKGEVNYVRFYS